MPRVPVISIIDDDASVRAAANRLVRSLGYIAYPFASAREFLKFVASERHLVSDRRRSDAGDERPRAAKPAASPRARAPDHFHYRLPRGDGPKAALDAGAVCFLIKPFDGPTLAQIPRQSPAAGWPEIGRNFPPIGCVGSFGIDPAPTPLNQSIPLSNQFDARANLRRMEPFPSVDLP